MTDADEMRRHQRRRLHQLREELASIEREVAQTHLVAAEAVREARNATFHAWTLLATPLEEDEDH